MKHRALLLAALGLLGTTSLVAGCRSDLAETKTYACASQPLFEDHVSPYLERRCATLDCHGGIARPMRIYGQLGLRHPDEANVSGGKATTAAELAANYASVCNLEPEKMNDAVANFGNTAEELLLIRKARGEEKHKGGKVVNEADHADNCLKMWLQGNEAATEAECAAAVKQLE